MTQPSTRHTETGSTTRRDFLAKTTAAASTVFSFSIVPRHVLGGPGQTPPSERPNMAGIGCGGMGGGDIGTFTKLGASFIALCDVDQERAAGTLQRFSRDARQRSEEHRRGDCGDPGPHPRRCRDGRDQSGETCLRPETVDAYPARMPGTDQSGKEGGCGHVDGESGARVRGIETDERVDSGRHPRRSPRSSCLV